MNKKSITRRDVTKEELDRFLDFIPAENRDSVIKLMQKNKNAAAIRSIVRRGISEDEVNRFLDLFPKDERDEVIKLISKNKNVVAIHVIIVTEENMADCCGRSRIVVTDARVRSDISVFRFDRKFAYFNEKNKAFILSFVSRCFATLKLIFSSSMMSVFASGIDGMSATIRGLYSSHNHLAIALFSKVKDIAVLDLSQNNAKVSDDIWNIILSDRDNVKHILRGYISKKYYFSDNTKNDIKKRLHALYDSLPYSKKPNAVDKSEKDEAVVNAADASEKGEITTFAKASKKVSESLYAAIDDWYARSKKENSYNADYLSALEKIYSEFKKGLVGREDSTNAGKTGTE